MKKFQYQCLFDLSLSLGLFNCCFKRISMAISHLRCSDGEIRTFEHDDQRCYEMVESNLINYF